MLIQAIYYTIYVFNNFDNQLDLTIDFLWRIKINAQSTTVYIK